MILTNLSSF